MNLRHQQLSDSELFLQTKNAAGIEKEATIALLEYLLEIDQRRLYSQKSYSSLFEYVVKELGYSEPSAADRVNAVRLMRAVPEVKNHLSENRLTLTSASQIQRFFKTEHKATQRHLPESSKISIIEACLDQSKRDVEKTLFLKQSVQAQALNQEKIKLISHERSEIKFTIDECTLKKLQSVKSLMGERSIESIFDEALDLLLLKEQKKRGMIAKEKGLKLDGANAKTVSARTDHEKVANITDPTRPAEWSEPSKLNSRFIPIDLKRFVFNRSKGQCEFVARVTKKRCESHYRLQIDHIYPFALGGRTEVSNLRHLCMSHNLRMAKEWGLD